MTNDQKEALELAKKCGAKIFHKEDGIHIVVADNHSSGNATQFVPKFAAALEEKHRAKIAMLTEACMPFSNVVRTTDGRIPTERLSFADWHNLTKAVSATQQDTDAFIAEKQAEAIRQFIEKFSFEDAVNQYRCQYCKDEDGEGSGLPLADALCTVGMPFANAQSEVELLADYIGGAMLDELRASAAQPEMSSQQ